MADEKMPDTPTIEQLKDFIKLELFPETFGDPEKFKRLREEMKRVPGEIPPFFHVIEYFWDTPVGTIQILLPTLTKILAFRVGGAH
jgi:hypothetical protein